MGSPMDQLRELEPILCLAVFQPAQLQHRSVNNGRLLPLVEGGRSHLRPSQRMSAVFLSATGGDNPSAYDLDKERERHPSRVLLRGLRRTKVDRLERHHPSLLDRALAAKYVVDSNPNLTRKPVMRKAFATNVTEGLVDPRRSSIVGRDQLRTSGSRPRSQSVTDVEVKSQLAAIKAESPQPGSPLATKPRDQTSPPVALRPQMVSLPPAVVAIPQTRAPAATGDDLRGAGGGAASSPDRGSLSSSGGDMPGLEPTAEADGEASDESFEHLEPPDIPASLTNTVSMFLVSATPYFDGRAEHIVVDPEGLILDLQDFVDRFDGSPELDFVGYWIHEREMELVDIVIDSPIEAVLMYMVADLVGEFDRVEQLQAEE